MGKRKEVRYPEASSLSVDTLKIEVEMLKQELFIMRGEIKRFQNTVYPLVENVIETSIKIARGVNPRSKSTEKCASTQQN